MSRYSVFLSDCLKYSTIDNYVSGVISLNMYFGYDIRCIRQDFAFHSALLGLRRILGDPVAIRVTLTVEDLLKMYDCVNTGDYNECVMWACLVTIKLSLFIAEEQSGAQLGEGEGGAFPAQRGDHVSRLGGDDTGEQLEDDSVRTKRTFGANHVHGGVAVVCG